MPVLPSGEALATAMEIRRDSYIIEDTSKVRIVFEKQE